MEQSILCPHVQDGVGQPRVGGLEELVLLPEALALLFDPRRHHPVLPAGGALLAGGSCVGRTQHVGRRRAGRTRRWFGVHQCLADEVPKLGVRRGLQGQRTGAPGLRRPRTQRIGRAGCAQLCFPAQHTDLGQINWPQVSC